MKTMMIVAIAVLVVSPVIFWNDVKSMFDGGKEIMINEETEPEVVQQWDLPAELVEISGLVYLSPGKFLCVQDEEGAVFTYNTATATIENKILFGGPGDYEDLAITPEALFVVRSDGKLFELKNWKTGRAQVKEYTTPLTAKHNVEGLTYDAVNNRLLLALKGKAPVETGKPVYAFDLSQLQLESEEVFFVKAGNESTAGKKKKKGKNDGGYQPSGIAIHPQTGSYYITEGEQPRLMITDGSGSVRKLFNMDGKKFIQAEGITFSPEGKMYISNEGKDGKANILEVEVRE